MIFRFFKIEFSINKAVNYISRKISLALFYNIQPISFVIFNKLYKKFILERNTNDSEISLYFNNGFVKLKINLKNVIKKYKKNFFIKKNNDIKSKNIKFYLSERKKKLFLDEIKKKLKPLKSKLENYFNCEVHYSLFQVFRNYRIENKFDLKKQYYANHYHQDSYLFTYHKIFVNLMDINIEDGPLHVVPINNLKKFCKSFNYKDNHDYSFSGDEKLVYKNTGKLGDCFLFSSTEVIHKAGIPKNLGMH
jgi:hypothetical protein